MYGAVAIPEPRLSDRESDKLARRLAAISAILDYARANLTNARRILPASPNISPIKRQDPY